MSLKEGVAMSAKRQTKSDSQIQQEVLRELKWDTRVEETEVGVTVERGIVTLTGTLAGYGKKLAAQEAAHRVFGVLDVANDIQVRVPGNMARTDAEIAQAVRNALEWDVWVTEDHTLEKVNALMRKHVVRSKAGRTPQYLENLMYLEHYHDFTWLTPWLAICAEEPCLGLPRETRLIGILVPPLFHLILARVDGEMKIVAAIMIDVYHLTVGPRISTDQLSEEIFSADPNNIDTVEWHQKKSVSYAYR
jgi:BON domain